LKSLALLFVATSLAGCGDCNRDSIISCIGDTPAVCSNADISDDGDECCKFTNKIIQCHKDEKCECDAERSETDGKPTVKAYMDHLRSAMLLCPLAGVTADTFCGS